MVINPTRELTIDAYPDADFAGMYGHEKPTDPACAKSHSGFVIVFAGVPVLWQSKLQTQSALSINGGRGDCLGRMYEGTHSDHGYGSITSCCCWDIRWRT